MILSSGSLVWAGGQSDQPVEDSVREGEVFEPVTLTDSSDREITISKSVESIAYTFAFGEPLNILGVWDKVVAVDGSHQGGGVDFPGLEELPVISSHGNCMDLNYEKILELDPDIFFTNYFPSMPGFDELVRTLEPEIPVVCLNLCDPLTIVENFEKLGRILGREQAADEYIAFYDGILDDIQGRLSGLSDEDKPRVFYKMGMGNTEDLMTFTDESQISEHRSMVTGSINIAADLPSQGGWVYNIDPEWLVSENPDVIIDFGMYNGIIGADANNLSAAEELYEKIISLNVLSQIGSVKEGKLFIIWTESFTSTGFIVNYAYTAKRLHPDLFEDFDPVAIHQEYYTKFLNVDFDVSKQGIFIYP